MAKNNKTRFFYVLYSDKTRVFDQSERTYYPIYIIISNTRTRLLYNEREIFDTAQSKAECSIENFSFIVQEALVRVFENKTRTNPNPFNIQSEFTAGDRLTMASHLTCLNEKTMN